MKGLQHRDRGSAARVGLKPSAALGRQLTELHQPSDVAFEKPEFMAIMGSRLGDQIMQDQSMEEDGGAE